MVLHKLYLLQPTRAVLPVLGKEVDEWYGIIIRGSVTGVGVCHHPDIMLIACTTTYVGRHAGRDRASPW